MKYGSKSPKPASTRRSRVTSSAWTLASFVAVVVAGCGVYTFTGGGGLPGHIDSVAILPFENRTTQFTLTQELTQALQDNVPGRLGLDFADEATADAVLRGSIVRYNESAVIYQRDRATAGPEISQRRVDITVSVELYDAREGRVLWTAGSLSASGEYLPDSQTEEAGRQLAIENLVQRIIDGAQSQW